MQNNPSAQPAATDFLEMWKCFNQMAHDSGIVKRALENFSRDQSAWLNYYLYFNHYQVVGQTLLVYCLRELLDIAATHQFSDFDLTGYQLEPEQDDHDEVAGNLRQALDDVDVFQFASVRSKGELKKILPNLVAAEGCLKVLVLPVLDAQELLAYRKKFEPVLQDSAATRNAEYVVLYPQLPGRQQVTWNYQVFDKHGAGPVEQLDDQEEAT